MAHHTQMNAKVTALPRAGHESASIVDRVQGLDWERLAQELDSSGNAVIEGLLSAAECQDLVRLYPEAGTFRSRVIMGRHGFGRGEYKYFAYPLPAQVTALRTAIYPHLAPIANRWNAQMGIDVTFPADHAGFLTRCHAAGQQQPTPLLLQYQAGDFNCLHQDLYGEHVFPLQVAVLLSQPGKDFTGGEFVMTEQRPRMQSRPEVVPLARGDAVIFAVHHRPVQGTRGVYRVNLRHGVSRAFRASAYAGGYFSRRQVGRLATVALPSPDHNQGAAFPRSRLSLACVVRAIIRAASSPVGDS